MKIKKNKRAAGKILSIYWFAILVIVAFGVWAMTTAYYRHPLDVREMEVNILSNKVSDCISQKGRISPDFFDDEGNLSFTGKDFEQVCTFNPHVEGEQKGDRSEYYIEMSFFDIGEKQRLEVIYGEPSIKDSDCEALQKDTSFERLAKCIKKRFYVLDNKDQQVLVEVFVGLRKQGKNVKL